MPLAHARLRIWLVTATLLAAACVETPAEPRPVGEEHDDPAEFSTGSSDYASAVAANAHGIYLGGHTAGSVAGESAGSFDGFVRRYHPEGDLIWEVQFGGKDADYVNDIAVDGAGNVYVVGVTTGSLAGSRGSDDAYLRKYDAAGIELWTRQFGTDLDDSGAAIALDSSGAIFVAGTTGHDLVGGSHSGGFDGFVRKYQPDGTVVWTRQFGSSTWDDVEALAIDLQGNLYVGGGTYGNIAGETNGSVSAYLRKYSSTGAHRWTRQFGTNPLNERITAIAVNDAGQAFVAGHTESAMSADGIGDVFVRRYSPAGDSLFALWVSGNGQTVRARDVAISGTRFYLTGGTEASLTGIPMFTRDAYVLEIKNDIVQWTRQWDSGEFDESHAIVAFDGGLYVAGHTTAAFAGTNAGAEDAFLRRLTGFGEVIWTDQ